MNPEPVVRRAFSRVAAQLAVANLAGATLVFVYLAIVSPVPAYVSDERQRHIVLVKPTRRRRRAGGPTAPPSCAAGPRRHIYAPLPA